MTELQSIRLSIVSVFSSCHLQRSVFELVLFSNYDFIRLKSRCRVGQKLCRGSGEGCGPVFPWLSHQLESHQTTGVRSRSLLSACGHSQPVLSTLTPDAGQWSYKKKNQHNDIRLSTFMIFALVHTEKNKYHMFSVAVGI